MVDYIGQQLGNYRVLRQLGRGGFAEVYLGEHVRLGMKAAIKVLHTNLVGEEIEAFQREAQIIANLGHPHIVRILDFDVQHGTPFLVLDYAPNGSLREKHPRGNPVDLALVVQYTRQIGSALQYAHDQKLIHRDVKPENMLVGKQGQLLLSDFGIASVAHSTSSMSTQVAIGTMPYMAPEQIQGQARPASDQYALAVTVYQWLCGELPFQGSSAEIIAKHLAAPPPPLRSKIPQLSPMVERVVMTALAKDPKERFGSVLAFINALEQSHTAGAVQSASVATPPLSPFEPALSVALSSQPAEPARIASPVAPVNTPSFDNRVQAQDIRATPQPLYPVHQQLQPISPRRTNPWLIWLVGTLIIMLLGAIAIVVIPTIIVYGPRSGNNNNNAIVVTSPTIDDDPGSTSSNSGGLGVCQVGTYYNLATGVLQGTATRFHKGQPIYLACTVNAGVNPDYVTSQLSKRSQGDVNAPGGIGDPAHSMYYAMVTLQSAGSYTWTASYQEQLITVTFQVV